MNKRKLLLVDDEPNILITLSALLNMHGYEVSRAATVAEALAAIQADKYEVLLTDLNIGNPGDGFTVVSAMRRVQPNVVTIIITGFPAFESALEAIRQQVDDYVVKPADVEHLLSCVEAKLQNRKPHRPVQAKRAVEVVHEKRDSIIGRWLTMVEADAELATIPVTKTARQGYLPEFLEALTTQVEAHEERVANKAWEAAAAHGKARREQGYSIPLLARESRILWTVLFGVLQDHLLEINISHLLSDMAALSESINRQLENSLRAYLNG